MPTFYNKPQILAKNVKWLWFDDYYDGPLEGMVEIRGIRYWAIAKSLDKKNRFVYAVYKLSCKRQDYEERKHNLWLKCVEVERLTQTHVGYYFYWAMTATSDLVFGKSRSKLIGWFKDGGYNDLCFWRSSLGPF